MRAETILILGGTREAAELAARLVSAKPAARIVTSLAGRTKEPAPLAGETRAGGFGGAEGLAAWLREHRATALVDATHPFAETISRNAASAALAAGVPLLRLARPAWTRVPGDDWREVASLDAAAAALAPGAVALLALGRQHLAPFAPRRDCRFVVRMVDPPGTPLPFPAELVLGRPSADPAEEAALLSQRGVGVIVCRNSGGDGAYAKIVAARSLRLPVIMVARPDDGNGKSFATVEAVLDAMACAPTTRGEQT